MLDLTNDVLIWIDTVQLIELNILYTNMNRWIICSCQLHDFRFQNNSNSVMIILKSNLVRFLLLIGNQISSSCARYYDIDSWTRQSGIAVVGNASYRKHGAYSREARKKSGWCFES